jgi:hypothetical protein
VLPHPQSLKIIGKLFIGKMLLGPQNWSLNFFFNIFFENEQYQHRLK